MADLSNRFEFLDHTADVQIRAWGDDLKEAFENAAIAMTAYITDLDTVEMLTKETIKVEADDLLGLFYRFLDSVLFLFNASPFLLSKRVRILKFERPKDDKDQGMGDTEGNSEYLIEAECYGEPFSMAKHPQGTEIKAVTYSNMKIFDEDTRHEVLFIIDI